MTIQLPVDFVCGSKFAEDAEVKTSTLAEGVPAGYMGLDCGAKTVELNRALIMAAKTIVWNGPQGVFEFKNFSSGSFACLDDVIAATKVGGGDFVLFV